MDKDILNQQSQHWETNFSNKHEMFGLEPSYTEKKAQDIFKENKWSKVNELVADLGRDRNNLRKNAKKVKDVE